jgi:hypothetical protein
MWLVLRGLAAFFVSMLPNEALNIIHELYEQDKDYPDSSSEDYAARLAALNASIDAWEGETKKGTLWRELFTPYAGVTTTGNQADAPADFLAAGGYIWIGNDRYEFVRPEKSRMIRNDEPTKKIYWVTGYKGNYKFNFSPSIGSGVAFETDYYRTSTKFANGLEGTHLEMSDPYFGIYFVLSRLYYDDENEDEGKRHWEIAAGKLAAMGLANDTTPFYQSNLLDDLAEPGFGH